MKFTSFIKSHLPSKPAFPFALVKPEIERVEQLLIEHSCSFDPDVEGYIRYICKSSGKRIRPALAILSGGATGGVHDGHHKLAVILEFIHIASLVHDDIMDGASLRRDMPTASAKWGNALSVLLGDSLFAYALELATQFEDLTVCRSIAAASRDVACGEILQTQRRFDFSLSMEEYFRIIEMKTAALFSAATQLGALINGQNDEVVQAMYTYGSKLGIAYQVYDDCIDLVGDEAEIGKTLGTDLIKGKLTLPILYLLEEASVEQREKLQTMLLNGETMDASVLAGIAGYAGSLKKAVNHGKKLLQEARDCLNVLTESEHKKALIAITTYTEDLLNRCNS